MGKIAFRIEKQRRIITYALELTEFILCVRHDRAQKGDLGGRELEGVHEAEALLEATEDRVLAAEGVLTEEEVERGAICAAELHTGLAYSTCSCADVDKFW